MLLSISGKIHTFLQWYGEILSEKNRRSLIIPDGFAHGFQALEDVVNLFSFKTLREKIDLD